MSTKKLDVKATTGNVLTAIRQHTPEEQTKIVADVISEIVIDRANKYYGLRKESNKAGENLELLMKIVPGFEDVVKTTAEKIDKEK